MLTYSRITFVTMAFIAVLSTRVAAEERKSIISVNPNIPDWAAKGLPAPAPSTMSDQPNIPEPIPSPPVVRPGAEPKAQEGAQEPKGKR